MHNTIEQTTQTQVPEEADGVETAEAIATFVVVHPNDYDEVPFSVLFEMVD